MKVTSFLVNFILAFRIFAADPVVRLPLVTKEFEAKILAFEGSKYLTAIEGDWSYSYSSAQGAYTYFIAKTPGTDGGRILRMDPIVTIFGGMTSMPLVFTDTSTGESFSPTLEIHDTRSGPYDYTADSTGVLLNYYQYGSMVVGGETVYVGIGFQHSPRYPMVCLTWGAEAEPFVVGRIVDTFEQVAIEIPATETVLQLSDVSGQEGVPDGMYLFISSPTEYGDFQTEVSTDLSKWSAAELTPYAIYGDQVIYQVPSKDVGFYRVR